MLCWFGTKLAMPLISNLQSPPAARNLPKPTVLLGLLRRGTSIYQLYGKRTIKLVYKASVRSWSWRSQKYT